MNSQILIGNSELIISRVTEILESNSLKKEHPDVLWMEEEKLGVEQAKIIREFLSLKPYSATGRVVFVLNSQNFTPEAQNSLLKTLEEPPQSAKILLGASNDQKILPTILSRCEIVNLDQGGEDQSSAVNPDIEKLLKATVEERFEFVEKLEDKEAWLNALVNHFHHRIQTDHSKKTIDFSKELLHAEEWQERSGSNTRAILEYLMLKMPIL